jgi:hypothetical protein
LAFVPLPLLLELQQVPQVAVEVPEDSDRAVAFFDRLAYKDYAFALVRVEIAPKIICVKKQEHATTRLIADT